MDSIVIDILKYDYDYSFVDYQSGEEKGIIILNVKPINSDI